MSASGPAFFNMIEITTDYKSKNGSPYAVASVGIEKRELIVRWGDGHTSSYHSVWLRHQCECDACGTCRTGVRMLHIQDIPDDIGPSLKAWTDEEIHITWTNDGHESVYAARWLRDHCCSDEERARRRQRPILWDTSIGDDVPWADFTEVEANARARLAMLQTVCDYGFCKIANVPTDAGEKHRLIELVGPQRQTNYGTYNLTKRAKAENVAEVSMTLDPHSDEAYRLSHVGITVFQVLHQTKGGGDTTLVDGFEAARRLRETSPEDFKLLTKLPIPCQRVDMALYSDRMPRSFISYIPAIRLDSWGEVCGIRMNERQIAPLDLPAHQVGPCYRAMRRFLDILYDPEMRLTFKLTRGEGLLFDNHRLLHGRTGFDIETPPRQVLTSTVDLEEFHSTMRMLRLAEGQDGIRITYSQGLLG